MWQLYFPVYINLENSQPREELRSFSQSQTVRVLFSECSYSNIFLFPTLSGKKRKKVSSVNGYSEYNNVIGLEHFLRNLIAK